MSICPNGTSRIRGNMQLKFIINPGEAFDPYDDHFPEGYEHIRDSATMGIETFVDRLIDNNNNE